VPNPRFEKLDPAKRSALLAAASAEFAEHGLERSSCNRIIAESGLSKGSFYYYFDSKEDLYLTVVKDALSAFAEGVGDPRDVDSVEEFWTECARLYRRLLEFGLTRPVLVGLLRSMAELTPGHMTDDLMQQTAVKETEVYSPMILRGVALGAVRTDLPVEVLLAFALALFRAQMGMGLQRWLEYGPGDVEQTVGMMIDVFRRIATPA